MNKMKKEIKELREKIIHLEGLRDILGDEVVDPKIAELQALIQTAGGAVIAGDINTGGGDFVGRDKNLTVGQGGVHIGGDVSNSNIVTGNNNVVGSTITQKAEYLQNLYAKIESRPDTDQLDKEDLKSAVAEIAEEDNKGENADESFIARRLRNIQRIAPDILEVALATIANPAAGFGMVAKKVAERMG